MEHMNDLIISPKYIMNKFSRNGLKPLCLNKVLMSLEKSGSVSKIKESTKPETSFISRLGSSIYTSVTSWIWSSSGGGEMMDSSDEDDEEFDETTTASSTRAVNLHYILLNNMKRLANEIQKYLDNAAMLGDGGDKIAVLLYSKPSDPESIRNGMTLQSFLRDRGYEHELPLEHIKMIATWLDRNTPAQLVSMGDQKEEALLFQRVDNVNKEDSKVTDPAVGKLLIRATIERIEQRIDELSKDIRSLKKKAVLLNKQGRKTEALVYVKRYKILIGYAEKRAVVASTLMLTLDKIREMEDNKIVFDTYSLAAVTMKEQREMLGLSSDAVEEVTETLREELDHSEEISNSIATSGDALPGLSDVDEKDLLAELAEIEAIVAEEEALSLPSAPTTKLTAATSTSGVTRPVQVTPTEPVKDRPKTPPLPVEIFAEVPPSNLSAAPPTVSATFSARTTSSTSTTSSSESRRAVLSSLGNKTPTRSSRVPSIKRTPTAASRVPSIKRTPTSKRGATRVGTITSNFRPRKIAKSLPS